MLFSWLLGPAGGVFGCGCARTPKALSCLRTKECEGDILEYAPYGHTQTSSGELVVEDEFLPGSLPIGPVIRTLPTYATGQDALPFSCLHGEPLFSGDILRLSLGDSIHEAVMVVYINGFCIKPRVVVPHLQTPGICRLWSPFSLVEKCQVKTKQHDAQWAIFKMTTFRKEGQDTSYYFATTGSDAPAERDRWVEEITQAISNLTLSLFPRFDISVDPVPGRVATSTRILAGYLLQGTPADRASMVFCELHAYLGREARLALYQDEWCDQEVLSIPICDSSIVSTRKGAYCTVFGINDQLFCARTEDERELWLRAVSNIKVKLMFDAPDPTAQELEVFRSAVHERVEALPPPLPPGGPAAAAAFAAAVANAGSRGVVLTEAPRRPPPGPQGDASADPRPIPEDDDDDDRDGRCYPRSPAVARLGASLLAASPAPSPPPLPNSQLQAGASVRQGIVSMDACSGAEIEGL